MLHYLKLIDENLLKRDEVFICTKNGYVTNDGDIQEDFMQYVMREFGQPGIVKEGDISSGYHCMTIPYLQDQLERSLKNYESRMDFCFPEYSLIFQ